MWAELIAALPGDASPHPPAPESAIRECARLLGEQVPGQLAALSSESNGVDGEYGLGLIWPIERIIADNLHFRGNAEFAQLYMPFDPLLFFADAGNGDQFALVPHTGRRDVFAWDHENDSRIWVAPGLSEYLRWWTAGRLKL